MTLYTKMNLKQIDEKVFRVWKKLHLFYVAPINQHSEKAKFFSSKSYNPKFMYRKLQFNPSALKQELKKCKAALCGKEPRSIATLLSKKTDDLIQFISLLESVGAHNFSKRSLQYYGQPNNALVQKSAKLVNENVVEPVEDVSSSKVVAYLKREVKRRKLGWKVKEAANIGAKADNATSERTLYIKKSEFFSRAALKRLAVHELGVHAKRAENGLKQDYKLFFMGTADCEFTEEGLAVRMEEENKVLDKHLLKAYAGRVLAVHLSLKKSFRGVFNVLSKHFPPHEAYQLTFRAKRGLSDTSKPGAFTKDYIYLYGYERLKNVKNLKPLFIGRIDLDDLKVLRHN